MRIRELAVKQKTAIRLKHTSINQKWRTKWHYSIVLEDAENDYTTYFRQAISAVWKTNLQLCQSVTKYDKALERAIRISP